MSVLILICRYGPSLVLSLQQYLLLLQLCRKKKGWSSISVQHRILPKYTGFGKNGGIYGQTAEVQAATRGEKNALSKAKMYLKIMAFSKKGLVKQLKFDGFSDKEAKYGASKCGANWKKQAAKKAKEYLQICRFQSRN